MPSSNTSIMDTLSIIPREVQVHTLSFLRAYDLSALQQTCRFYNDPNLIHSVVCYTAEHVYTPELTKDIVQPGNKGAYTLEHLRNIELTVVARLLSLPEPKTGFYVSKSWMRKTLLWLEKVNEPPPKKKLTKKQERQRARRLSDVSPPWPNVNSDILCCHQKLQRCSAKSARARRRLMDKQAWKILKKLYPDSTQVESVSGECLQCMLETETVRKTEKDIVEQAKLARKKPLSNSHVRRFYTRTRGVPNHCLVSEPSTNTCPMTSGTYFIIPRAWCHHWRRYIKTGEGSMPHPPESSAFLCDAHKHALLPPHLEAYLNGETSQLLSTIRPAETPMSPISPRASFTSVPVGVQPNMDAATVHALMAAGISQAELATQRMAMLQLEQQQEPRSPAPCLELSSSTQNDMLDRENHVVVELVTEEEWAALQETGCWPKQLNQFLVSITVPPGGKFSFSTLPCRECDPTGSRFTACAEIKYRRKRWEPKSVEQRRTPHVEY
jgi:hypothetical protein